MRQRALDDRELPRAERRPHYRLRVLAGADGVRSRAGAVVASAMELPFSLDPEAEINLVGWRVFAPGR